MLQRSVDQAVMSIYDSRPAKRNQAYLFLFTRFKAHSRSGSDIQAHSVSGNSIKFQGAVYFKKVVVATYLYGPVSCMLDEYEHGSTPFVRFNIACCLV